MRGEFNTETVKMWGGRRKTFTKGLEKSGEKHQSVSTCPTRCNPTDCSPLGSSIPRISQARTLEWTAIPFSRRSSQPRDQTWVSQIAGRFFIIWATREASRGKILEKHSVRVRGDGMRMRGRDARLDPSCSRHPSPGASQEERKPADIYSAQMSPAPAAIGLQPHKKLQVRSSHVSQSNHRPMRNTKMPLSNPGNRGEKTLYMDITRWSTPKSDWLYSLQQKMEKLYTVSKNKTRSWLWLRSWAPYCQIQTEIEESRENH